MRASIAFRSLRQRAIGTGLVEKRKVKQAKTCILAAAHFTYYNVVIICHSSEEKQKMVVVDRCVSVCQ